MAFPAEVDVDERLGGDGPVFVSEGTQRADGGESGGDGDAEAGLFGAVVGLVRLANADAEGHRQGYDARGETLAVTRGGRFVAVRLTQEFCPATPRFATMGLMSRLLGGDRSTDDYVELDIGDFDATPSDSGTQVHIATIGEQGDVIPIKDAIYDGDVVIADITRHTTTDRTMEHISDELKQVADEVGGDIIQKDDDQLIITPGGISVARERLEVGKSQRSSPFPSYRVTGASTQSSQSRSASRTISSSSSRKRFSEPSWSPNAQSRTDDSGRTAVSLAGDEIRRTRELIHDRLNGDAELAAVAVVFAAPVARGWHPGPPDRNPALAVAERSPGGVGDDDWNAQRLRKAFSRRRGILGARAGDRRRGRSSGRCPR